MFEGVDFDCNIHRGNICLGARCNGPARLGTLKTVPLFLSIMSAALRTKTTRTYRELIASSTTIRFL
jgi:hypothetical protein